jgi:hypothetical protein
VLALYSSGIYIGSGLGLTIGGDRRSLGRGIRGATAHRLHGWRSRSSPWAAGTAASRLCAAATVRGAMDNLHVAVNRIRSVPSRAAAVIRRNALQSLAFGRGAGGLREPRRAALRRPPR